MSIGMLIIIVVEGLWLRAKSLNKHSSIREYQESFIRFKCYRLSIQAISRPNKMFVESIQLIEHCDYMSSADPITVDLFK